MSTTTRVFALTTSHYTCRLNYILWLEDVIQAVSLAEAEHDSERIVRGLDM